MTAYRVTRNSDPQPPKLPLLPMDEPSHWTDWLLRGAVAVTVAGILALTGCGL
jgi:hypothetical protein